LGLSFRCSFVVHNFLDNLCAPPQDVNMNNI
jgi:hypothetical protein